MAGQELRLPKFGMQMVDGLVAEWLVADGATVEHGQEVVMIEMDKADTAVEAPGSGKIKIVVPAGETVEVGTLIAVIS